MLPLRFLHELLPWLDGLLKSVMLWIVFSKNRSDFSLRFFSISGLTRLRSRCKSNASVVFNDSEVTFMREGNDIDFCRFLYCILYIYSAAKPKKTSTCSILLEVFRHFCDLFIRDFRGVSKQILEMFFLHLYSFFLDDSLYVVPSISFQTILYRHLKLLWTPENSLCYCYASYEMTDQFLWFQIQMNSYSSNWNTPY